MKLEEAFERIVIINLPFKVDRKIRLAKHLEEIGISDPAVIRWERGICGDWTPPPAWWGAGNGAWGCLMSHLRIAQDAVHDKLANYCVLEDDVCFHPHSPAMLGSLMAELPSDWGQVYLGGQFLHQEPVAVTPWVVRPHNVNRTHAFALSKDTIPRFLQHIMHAPDYFDVKTWDVEAPEKSHNCYHIDHQLGCAHERVHWKTYAPKWWLAGQEAGSSNISGQCNPRMWWHWRDQGYNLPFFFLETNATKQQRDSVRPFIHAGFNLINDSFVDIGLCNDLCDNRLLDWLRMIAGEAVEQWKLPGFEVPHKMQNLVNRVQKLWSAGLLKAEENQMRVTADYPFNGLCGGIPT